MEERSILSRLKREPRAKLAGYARFRHIRLEFKEVLWIINRDEIHTAIYGQEMITHLQIFPDDFHQLLSFYKIIGIVLNIRQFKFIINNRKYINFVQQSASIINLITNPNLWQFEDDSSKINYAMRSNFIFPRINDDWKVIVLITYENPQYCFHK